MAASTIIQAGESIGNLVPNPVADLTSSATSVVNNLKETATDTIDGAISSVLGGTGGIGSAVGSVVGGLIGGLFGGTASVIAPNPPRIGVEGFTDDRAGIENPIPGQPQKTKLDMTPFFSITNPASDYWPLQPEEMNTPRLARGVTADTITEAQEMARTVVVTSKGFKLEPASPYAAQYPFNTVDESESGHFRETDDTPGAERIKESHRTGTFYEIHPDGGKVTKVVKDNFTAIMGDDSLQVMGSCKVMVNGDCSLFTLRDIEVFATTGIKLYSATSIEAMGSIVNLTALGEMTLTAIGPMTLESTGIITMIDSTGVDAGAIDLQ